MEPEYNGWRIVHLKHKRSIDWRLMFFVAVTVNVLLLTKMLWTTFF